MSTVSSESPKVQYSVQRELSDGSLNRISVRVPYFSKDDIHVYVSDIEIKDTTVEGSKYTWRWDGDYIAITPNVDQGIEVLVRRITPIDEAIHIFDGRSEFDDQSMDENFQQLIYIAQEYSEGSGIKDVFSDINMHGYKIKNVGWATDDDDVVTYGQYKQDAEGAKVAMQRAETAATKAEAHEKNTKAIANKAQTDITASKDRAITEITNRIAPEIDKARVHAITAQASAGTAVSASNRSEVILQDVMVLEDQAEGHATTAVQAKDEALVIKNEIQDGLDNLIDVAEPIKIVANNIQHVQTTSTNINDVNIVGADLEGSTANELFQDYGDLDNPDAPGTSIIGGNIKNVSDNIQHVRVDSENIEAIKTVAGAIDNLPEISATLGDAVKKAESARDTAQAQATVATQQANIAKQQVPLVQAEGTKQVQRVTAEGDKQVKRVQDAGTAAVQSVQNASTKKITDAQTTAVNAVITQQGSSISAVTAEGTKQIQAITNEGTSQIETVSDAGTTEVQKVTAEGTKQINLAKAQVTIATQKAQEATASATNAKNYADTIQASVDAAEASAQASHTSETKADTYAKNASASASTATAQATASASSAKAAKLSADNAALSKDSASASATTATQQAERAKQYADQMSTGQIQADWSETVPSSKAFILNKPTLGRLASKDSIAYTEITGAPPQPDLSGLATKNELQTGLASKANTKHTHTVAEITNLNSTLSGYVTTDTLTEELAKKQPKGDYATTSALTSGLAGKANSSHTHTKSQITDFPSIPDASTLIPKSGNRGALAGYSSSATGTTVNATSGDSLYASANVTVANGATGQTWTKVVKMSAGTVTLGTNWDWVGGETPELKYPCLLVCHWNQDKGIAGIVAGV